MNDPQNSNQTVSLDEWEEDVRRHHKIPKGFWDTLKGQESGGDINAKSPTGVRGRWQVTQKTAAQYGLNRDDPFEQAVAAARYMRELYDQESKNFSDPRDAWLATRAKYYAGGDAVDSNGGLSTRSKDKLSNPATDVERFAKNWGAWRDRYGDDLAEFAPAQQAPRQAQSSPVSETAKPPGQPAQRGNIARNPVASPGNSPFAIKPYDPLGEIQNSEWQKKINVTSTPEQERVASQRKARIQSERERFKNRSTFGQAVEAMAASALGNAEPYLNPEARAALNETRVALGMDNPTYDSGLTHYVNTAKKAALRGAAAIPEGVGELVDLYNQTNFLPDVVPMPEGRGRVPVAPAFRPITDAAQAGSEMLFPTDAQRNDEFGTKFAAGAGSTVPFMAASLATGGAALAPALTGAAQNVQQIAREFDARRGDPSRRNASVAMAAITGLTESFGLGKLVKRMGIDASLAQRAIQIAEEGGQEALQEWLNNLNAKLIGAYDPQRAQLAGVAEAAVIGTLLGAVGEGAQGLSTVPGTMAANRQAAAVRAEVPRPLNFAPIKRFEKTQVIKVLPGGVAQSGAQSAAATAGAVTPSDDPLLAAFGLGGQAAPPQADASTQPATVKADAAVEPLRLYGPDEEPGIPTANRFLDTVKVDGQEVFFEAPKNLSRSAAQKLAARKYREANPAPPAPPAPRKLTPERKTGVLARQGRETGIIEAQLNTQELSQTDERRLGVKRQTPRDVLRDPFSAEALPPTPDTQPLSARDLEFERARGEMDRQLELADKLEADGDAAGALDAIEAYRYANRMAQNSIKGGRIGDVDRRMKLVTEWQQVKKRIEPLKQRAPVNARGLRAVGDTPLLDSKVNTGGVPSTELPGQQQNSIRFEDLAAKQKRSGTGGLRLLQRIRQLGGLNPAGHSGELVNAIERKQPGLINRKNGLKPDELLELLAVDEGYPVDRQDLNTLWKAIDDDASGKPVYPVTKSRTAEVADEEASYWEDRARSAALREEEAANAPTGKVSAPLPERVPSARMPSQPLPQAEPVASDETQTPGLTVDEVLAQPEPARRPGTTPFDGIKMVYSPGGRGLRLRLPYKNTGFLHAAKNKMGRYYEDKDRRGGEWFVDPKNADEIKRLAAFHFKQPVAVQGDTANFEPVPGGIPNPEESQYTQMARDKADAINELYQLEDVNSERGEALQNEIREYLAYQGFARKHYGALMAAIKSFHSDRARVQNDVERYRERLSTPEPPPSAPPAAAVATQPVEAPQAMPVAEQLTREGNSEPLYREPTAALNPPSRSLAEKQLREVANQRFRRMTFVDLREEINRMTELRNDDIRRGHLSSSARAQLLEDLHDAQETYSNRRSDLSKRVTKERDAIKADDEAIAVMAEKAANPKSRKQDRPVMTTERRRLAEERLRRAQAEFDAVPTLIEVPSAPSPETVAARRRRNIDAAQGRARLAVPVSERDSSAALPSGFLRAVEKPTERLVVHDNPAIDGKPVLAETADGRVVVANAENASGISIVKDRVDESGATGYTGELKEIETANLPVTEAVAQDELNATTQRNQNSQANVAGTQTTGKLGGQSARLDSQSGNARRGSQNLQTNQGNLSDGVGTEKAGDQPGQVSTQSQKLSVLPSGNANSPQINKANSTNELLQNEAADSDLPPNQPQLSADAEFVLRIIKTDGKGEVRRLALNKMTDLVNSKLNPALKELQDAGLIANESGTIRVNELAGDVVPYPDADVPVPAVPIETLPTTPAARAEQKTEDDKAAKVIIADFGEKIGGARKDLASKTGPKKAAKEVDQRPVWRRKYDIVLIAKGYQEGKFELIRDGRPTHRFFATREEAEAAIPLYEVSRKHRVSIQSRSDEAPVFAIYRAITERKRAVVKGGFESYDAAMKYMAEHPAKVIEHKFEFPEKPWLDRIEREGKSYREGDVSPQDFQQAFGFRGGEFGNWNKGSDGQAALNYAYDALMDLADVLGIPPRALSLNGELAIAFGARGHGGKQSARAHYELDHGVINLTKIRGAGSLAHEWFHALDHYLARQGGQAAARGENGKFPAKGYGSDFVTHGYGYKTKARQALVEAFNNVVRAMTVKTTEEVIAENRSQQNLDRVSDHLREGLENLRRQFVQDTSSYNKRFKKPTPEQLLQWDALAEQILRGEVGEKKIIGGKGFNFRETYQPIEDLNALYKAVQNRSFATMADGNAGRQLAARIRSMLEARERVTKASGGATETKKVATDYFREARAIDNTRTDEYWSTPHEMGARAFESFIYDRLNTRGEKSDYLVHGVENKYYVLFEMKPYPEGAEREAINIAFQNLFDTIEQKTGDNGVVYLASGLPLDELLFNRVPAKFDAKTLRREVVAKLKEIKATPAIEAKAVALVTQMTQAAEQNRATAGDRAGLKISFADKKFLPFLNADPYGRQFHEARGELLTLLAGGNKAKFFRPGMRKRFFETLGSAQTGAQLGTPKFVGMNIVQHFVFAGQENLVNIVASALDAGANRLTGKQRVVAKAKGSYFKDYFKGMKLARDMRRKGQQMPGMNPPEQLAASTRLGEAFERLLFWINEVPDSGNYVAHFKRAYDSAVKVAALNNQPLTPEMIDDAKAEANRAALRDENFVSNAATMVKDSLNALSSPVTGTRSFGLGDFVLKYTRTPGALVKRAIEYSPLGLFEAAHYAKDGLRGDQKAQRNAILSLSRAVVGTAETIGAGAALAALGLLAAPPDDEDYNLKTETARAGRRGYQLNLTALLRLPDLLTAYAHGQRYDNKPLPGDYLINIDKVQPWAMGASVGAKLFERWQRGELVSGGTLASVGQAASQSIATLLDVMGDQSLLKNVEKYIAQWRGASTEEKAASVARAIAVDVPSSFVPGLLREARNLADDKVRDTRPERREGLGGMFEESLNKVRAQMPSQSSKLPERSSLLDGRSAQTTQGRRSWPAKIAGALLPEIPSQYQPSPVLEEINRLNAILPDSERVNLTLPRLSEKGVRETTSDLRVREAAFGNLNDAQLERLINSVGYRAATDERKAKLIEDVFKKNRSLVKPRTRSIAAQ